MLAYLAEANRTRRLDKEVMALSGGPRLAETAGSPAMNGCDAVHCGCAPRRTPLPAEE